MLHHMGCWACDRWDWKLGMRCRVINGISTCEAIVQIGEAFEFFCVGHLHVSCTYTATHWLLQLVFGGSVLVYHIQVVA